MRIERRYTKAGQDAYAEIEFRQATSEIKNPDGSVVFRLEKIEVPASWSQVATDILAQKYFRKAGVPAVMKRVEEELIPSWAWRSVADEEALAGLPQAPSQYNPFNNPQAATRRRNEVLDAMAKNGSITADQAAEAKQQPLGTKANTFLTKRREGFFFDYVTQELRQVQLWFHVRQSLVRR